MKNLPVRSLAAAACALSVNFAGAQNEVVGNPAPLPTGWWQQDGITGDWFGARTTLADYGVEVFGGYTVEVWGNTTGGLERGAVYTGLLDFGVSVDLEKAIGWTGASVSTKWLWLSGQDASEDLVGNLLTISNIAGFNTLRMLELWFQQNLLEDKISLRVGQIAADSEFVISDYAGLFLNATFGWPPFAYLNLPEGGPGYPMGTLGTRLALNPLDWFTFQAAAFQGNVFAQNVNRHGFRWRLDAGTGYTFLNEAQFRWNHRDDETGLAGQFKAGAWMQTGSSADALADTTASGNYGFYAILDQMFFREPDGEVPAPVGQSKDGKTVVDGKADKDFKAPVTYEKSEQGLGGFGRIAFAESDRNFVNFYFDVGLTYRGLIPGRDDDTLGVAFAYAQLSNGARQSLRDEGSRPIGAEMVLEVTYQAQITKWLIIQPDLQYILNPGATSDSANALVVGARAAVTF
jgi:porin